MGGISFFLVPGCARVGYRILYLPIEMRSQQGIEADGPRNHYR